MQILANRIEFCWIHLHGIGSLENSLWGFDGQGIRVWLNALNMDTAVTDGQTEGVKESVNIPLDFYPLCKSWFSVLSLPYSTVLAVLMNKGIIIGAEHEATAKSNLPFVTFRHATSVSYILAFQI